MTLTDKTIKNVHRQNFMPRDKDSDESRRL